MTLKMLEKKGAENRTTTLRAVENVELNNRESGRTGRLQLVLPEQSFQRLDEIKEITEASSYAEVIRSALRIYEGLLVEGQLGSDIFVRRPDGREFALPIKLVVR